MISVSANSALLEKAEKSVSDFISRHCPEHCLDKKITPLFNMSTNTEDLGFKKQRTKTLSNLKVTIFLSRELKRSQRNALVSLLKNHLTSSFPNVKTTIYRKILALPVKPSVEKLTPVQQYKDLIWPASVVAIFFMMIFSGILGLYMFTRHKFKMQQNEIAYKKESTKQEDLIVEPTQTEFLEKIDQLKKEYAEGVAPLLQSLRNQRNKKEQYDLAKQLLGMSDFNRMITKNDIEWLHKSLRQYQNLSSQFDINHYHISTFEDYFFSSENLKGKAYLLGELSPDRWYSLLNQVDSSEKVKLAKIIKKGVNLNSAEKEELKRSLDQFESNGRNTLENMAVFLNPEERQKVEINSSFFSLEKRIDSLSQDELSELIINLSNNQLKLMLVTLKDQQELSTRVMRLIPVKRLKALENLVVEQSEKSKTENEINIRKVINQQGGAR